ncbi:MAG: hypothetical protein ABF313_10460, partial [Marivita sp.]
MREPHGCRGSRRLFSLKIPNSTARSRRFNADRGQSNWHAAMIMVTVGLISILSGAASLIWT